MDPVPVSGKFLRTLNCLHREGITHVFAVSAGVPANHGQPRLQVLEPACFLAHKDLCVRRDLDGQLLAVVCHERNAVLRQVNALDLAAHGLFAGSCAQAPFGRLFALAQVVLDLVLVQGHRQGRLTGPVTP